LKEDITTETAYLLDRVHVIAFAHADYIETAPFKQDAPCPSVVEVSPCPSKISVLLQSLGKRRFVAPKQNSNLLN